MCGVAVDTLRDMEVLFDGIPLDKVTTSMTINGPAIVLLCFYVALADKPRHPARARSAAPSRTTA
jgi:methylmalonyl-CoA mutase N-terminal domain/subunit